MIPPLISGVAHHSLRRAPRRGPCLQVRVSIKPAQGNFEQLRLHSLRDFPVKDRERTCQEDRIQQPSEEDPLHE
ncbi:MAG: hypothetical protein LZF60_80192 [Nitrospira sp.]|nr:MAG: hypothetical protein LZF60_80192 [Nitrospira sp.]